MVRCELCGNEVDSVLETKISGAILNVCPDCTEHGTIIDDENENSKTSTETKYSTSSKKSTNNSNKNNPTTNHNSTSNDNNNNSEDDYFKDVNNLALNYGEIIRDGRIKNNYSQKELSNKLNIKESYLKKIEDESMQPDMDLQNKLEKELDIDLNISDINY